MRQNKIGLIGGDEPFRTFMQMEDKRNRMGVESDSSIMALIIRYLMYGIENFSFYKSFSYTEIKDGDFRFPENHRVVIIMYYSHIIL